MNEKAQIRIGKKTLKTFKHVSIHQAINDHHSFELVVDYKTMESFGTHTLENSRVWMNESIVISFGERDFLGIITNVRLDERNGFNNDILVEGNSITILLEGGKHFQSWLHKDLESIVKDVIQDSGLQAVVAPVFTSPIEYTCQYGETHFQFLKRLARQYNEWLYYDGVRLIFGKPRRSQEPISISYDQEIKALNIGIASKPHQSTIYTYDGLYDTKIQAQTPGEIPGLNELGVYTFRASKDLYKIIPNSFPERKLNNRYEVDLFMQNKQAAAAADLHQLKAISTRQELTIGSLIRVNTLYREKGKLEVKRHGEYLITELHQTANDSQEYINEFTALSGGITVLPEPEVAPIITFREEATVISNDDPLGKGRVQVQFQWQTGVMKTSWLWVMTLDAGSSEAHPQNRGHVFIPEVGDQVMIDFRYNDPNQPFVMGSIFKGTKTTGGGKKNTVKSIKTCSGHSVILDDTPRKENISIIDKKGNHFIIDSAGENITLNALKDICLKAGKDIIMEAGENIVMTSGKDFNESVGGNKTTSINNQNSVSSGGDYTLMASNIYESADSNYESNAENITKSAGQDITLNAGENVNKQAGGKLNNNSNENSNLS